MFLDRVQTSKDIKQLSYDALELLSEEIRRFLIAHVAKTGGHLAANLGVVELTLALHRVFDVNKDRLVWDVGHQSYVHKILTGRKDRFDTLRQFQGLSGFPKTQESVADAFNTGHSSTSVSAATGLAMAAKMNGEDISAVAVIGDGALTGGMAYEALNHAGTLDIPLVVVLNDNGMSISQNVGGVSKKLAKIRNTQRYFEMKSDVKEFLDKVPVVGNSIKKAMSTGKNTLKRVVMHESLFDEFGFAYLGPVDGHNIQELETVLSRAKALKKPVVVHVHTQKGKGYVPAEKNPGYFHGVPEFDSETGLPLHEGASHDWASCFGQNLISLAEKNKDIVAICAAMGLGTGLDAFPEKFPDRFFDVGIAEQHAVTYAAGLAKAGKIPCVAIYSSFLQRAYDQLLHDVALQNLHIVFCVDRSGPVGKDGETHQGVFDISYASHLPNFTILSPSNKEDLSSMLRFAFEKCDGPVMIRYPRGEAIVADWNIAVQKPAQSHMVRDGEDVLLLAVGTTVPDALMAAELLKEKGVSCGVLDVKCIKPLDKETILKVCQGKKLIASLEDNVEVGGFGQLLTVLLKRDVNVFAYPDAPIVQGSVKELKSLYGLAPEQIAARILEKLQ